MINKSIIKNSLNTAIILALSAPVAQAADFYFGENEDIQLSINSQISIGSSWSTSNSDFYSDTNTVDGVKGAFHSATTDDDTLNFGKGDAFTTIIKGINDIQLDKNGFGAFLRVKYWYDTALKDNDVQHGNNPNGYVANTPLSDDGFSDTAKFSGIQILDAYLYGSFELGETPLDIRLGRQVVSWGESTFIQGGINSINPLDVSALRRPGATLKEGLLPVGMLYANAGLSENLSVEAFYQYEWAKTEIDGCGTFFSPADYVADGCNYISLNSSADPTSDMSDAAGRSIGLYAKRVDDLEPDDGGQYGIAARYFSEALNDTEFGFYYMNIHSRLPIASVYRGTNSTNPAVGNTPFVPFVALYGPTATPEQIASAELANSTYTIEFVEDLKVYGLSFATNVAGFALSGEVSYKPDVPTQINGNHAVGAAIFEDTRPLPLGQTVAAVDAGAYVAAWEPFDVTQLQMTAIQFFDQVLGASRVTFIGEVGLTLIDGIEAKRDINMQYGRDTIFGAPTVIGLDENNLAIFDSSEEGFKTDAAWGYRTRVEFDYPDLFAGISLKPILSWYHDVDGYSDQFVEGSTVASASVEALYQQKYSVTVSYTNFGGGEYSSVTDKDFVALSFAMSY